MAKCSNCGAETQLYEYGVPICMKCADARDAEFRDNKLAQEKHRPEDKESAL
jgi:hypothetical protein